MLAKTLCVGALTALMGGALAAPACADGFIRINRRPQQPSNVPLAVKYHKVNVAVKGQTATTKIDQVFYNPNNRVLEGTYMFPLPENAAIDDFILYINGKPVHAELLDRQKARDIYESIVRSQKDPALLEYVGREMFQASVFPIPARGDMRIQIQYQELLRRDAGLTTYRYPLNTEKFSSAPLNECAVEVTIASDEKLGTIVSPSHKIDVARTGDTTAKVSWEARNVTPDKDFYLYIGSAEKSGGLTLATYQGSDPEGTFLLMVSPRGVKAQQEPVAKDVIFVLDTSGSMGEGLKLKQAQKALRQCLGRLNAGDRFGVIAFSTEARGFREQLANADDEAVTAADQWVAGLEARGGTAIQEALEQAMKMLGPQPGDDMKDLKGPVKPAYVVFITDGAPTIGERDPDRLLDGVKKIAPERARVFCLGVGDDLNSYLIDRLAQQHRGAQEYVAGAEMAELETKVSAFYDKIAFPVLTDLKMEVVGLEITDMYPKMLPDLFRGSQLAVLGRYTGKSGQYAIRITGKIGFEQHTLVYEGKWDGASTGGETLPRIWAVRKIGYLLEEIRLRGETPEVKKEVVRLSKKYGVMTPYTSYLVVEDEALQQVNRPRRDWGGDPRPPSSGGPTGPSAPGGGFRRFSDDRKGEAQDAAKSLRSEGGRGVAGSKEVKKMKEGKADSLEEMDNDAEVRRIMRSVGDKTFYKQGEAWIDSSFDAGTQKVIAIVAFSDRYMELLTTHTGIGQWLALGEQVTVVIDGVAYQIAP